jgi:hypothetical protein
LLDNATSRNETERRRVAVARPIDRHVGTRRENAPMNVLRFCSAAVLLVALAAGAAGAESQDIPYRVVKKRWKPMLGNHRAVVRVDRSSDAVWAHLPWRRHEARPEEKNIVIVEAATGKEVKNRVAVRLNREFGDIAFQGTAAGEYYVYYLPQIKSPAKDPYTTRYAAPANTADQAWLARHGLTAARLGDGQWQTLPKAQVREFQTWSEFHSFDPMEVIATAAETRELVSKAAQPYLLFPEDRKYPIRIADDLPLRWIRRGPSAEFHGAACRGEFYAFQVGLFAAGRTIRDLAVEISDLRRQGDRSHLPGSGPKAGTDAQRWSSHKWDLSPSGLIPAANFHAFNFAGTDWLGRPIKKDVSVPQGKVQALWFGVQVPKDAAPGDYRGVLTFRSAGGETSKLTLSLAVSPEVLADGGVSDLWRHARLKWLDSTLGLDDEVVAPYTPVSTSGATVRCLGRAVTFAETGLPQSIESNHREVLAAPVAIVAETPAGPIAWTGGRPNFTQPAAGAVLCTSRSTGGPLAMTCQAKMEFDGYINYRVRLRAERRTDLKDIRLEIPVRRDVATYMMGLGRKGGYRPKEWKWIWQGHRANNLVWLGDVQAGLQCKLKGPQDTWDTNGLTAGIPQSWGNGGHGGATLGEQGETVTLRAYSGPRTLNAGEDVEFRFALLVTPVKPLDPQHWKQRYYHFCDRVVAVDKIVPTGAAIINCHHGNELNPNISYPFHHDEALAAYAAQAHAKGLKFKIYYNLGELSNYVTELWALRSLGYEVFCDGNGGGDSWLREHLTSHYAPAWHQPLADGRMDAALCLVKPSRWQNYYVEGVSYLMKRVGIDGLYLDGISYDRAVMKRVRKVLDRIRPGSLLDVHCGDSFNYGNMRCSTVNTYLEHCPYVNSLWPGEGYDYNEPPDFWLTEISGLPFGLFSEMLQGGGNPWRGMLYGMTNRLPWCGDPRPIWKIWDEFGIQQARMIGYWDKTCPVRTGRDDVLATAYVRGGQTLVSLASWAKEPVRCRLAIDWQALGLDPARACLRAPAITGFQPPAVLQPTETVPVYPGRGWLLLIEQAKPGMAALAPRDAYKNRRLLLEDRFDRASLGQPWKTSLSPQPKTVLKLAEQAIVLQAHANGCAFAERPLPAGSAIVQCAVQGDLNCGGTWGPGLTLVWPKKTLRVNLRGGGPYGIDDGANQWFTDMIAPTGWHHLRFRLEPQTVFIEGSWDGEFWFPIHAVSREAFPGDPIAVRLGKMSATGKCEDYTWLGPVGTSRIKHLQVYGHR